MYEILRERLILDFKIKTPSIGGVSLSKRPLILGISLLLLALLMIPASAQVFDWGHTWGSANGEDRALGVEVYEDGSVYVVGYASDIPNGIGGIDAFIAKFDSDGNLVWDRVWGRKGTAERFRKLIIIRDYIYVVGESYDGKNASIVVFDRDGNLLWDKDINLYALGGQLAGGVAYYSGYLYVAGTAFPGGGSKNYIFILKYDLKSGKLIWFKKIYRTDVDLYYADLSASTMRGSRLIVDKDRIYIPFSINVEEGGYGGGIIALDQDGNLKWSKQYWTRWTALASDGEYLYLMSKGGGGSELPRVYKIDNSTGDLKWCRHIEPIKSKTYFEDVYVGNDGVYIAGYLALTLSDSILLKLSKDGHLIWAMKYYNDSTGDYAYGLAIRGDDIYMVGTTSKKEMIAENIEEIERFEACTVDVQRYPVSIVDISEYSLPDSACIAKDPNANIDNPQNTVDAYIFHGIDTPDLRALVRGMDDKIYKNIYHELGGWHGWKKLPGTTPSGISAWYYRGMIYIAVRGSNDKIYYGMFDEIVGGFDGWYMVSGSTPSKPAITVDQGGNIYLVVRGMDNKIYINKKSAGGGWSGWQVISGSTPDAPAAAVIGDTLHIVVRGSDNGIWHAKVDTSTLSMIGSWTKISGSTPSAPDLTIHGQELYLAVRGSNSKIYINRYDGSSWLGWESIPTGSTPLSPAIKILGEKIYVMVTGNSNRLWIIEKDPVTGWGSWQRVSGASPSGPELS